MNSLPLPSYGLSSLVKLFISANLTFEFRARAAIFDCTIRDAPCTSYTSGAPGALTQNVAVRDSNPAPVVTQEMEATPANLSRRECQEGSEARGQATPPHKLSRAIAISQPWIQISDRRLHLMTADTHPGRNRLSAASTAGR
jgi:hypothetical protein